MLYFTNKTKLSKNVEQIYSFHVGVKKENISKKNTFKV